MPIMKDMFPSYTILAMENGFKPKYAVIQKRKEEMWVAREKEKTRENWRRIQLNKDRRKEEE